MCPVSGRVRGSSLDLHNHGEPGERIAARIMLALVPLEVLEQLYLRSIEGCAARGAALPGSRHVGRSEEHTSELQSLMRLSYAVFCLKKTKYQPHPSQFHTHLTHLPTRPYYTHMSLLPS